MKNIFSLSAIICFANLLTAQQWNGSSTTTGIINRDGKVSVEGLLFGKYGNALSGDPDPFQISSPQSIGTHDLILYGSGTSSTLNLRLYDGSLKFGQSTAPNAEIHNSGSGYFNGNIGIGTSNPSSILQVEKKSDTYDNMLSLTHKSSSGTIHSNWTFQQHTNGNLLVNGSKGSWVFEKKSDTYDDMLKFVHKSSSGSIHSVWDFQHHTNGNFVLFNSDNKSLFLNTGGSLGIGTTNTGSHKLAVEGSIGAREIKVEASGWSDFVFEKGYDLRTLEEVEQHINENGHLPEIPSETEVTENGINLGEMNAKLLQKIEELTLYLIEQNNQNQAQQARIEELEQKLSQLENE